MLGLGKVDPSLYLKAFELGARGVLVTACKDDTCHFCKEREWVERRTEIYCSTAQWVGNGYQTISNPLYLLTKR